MIDLTIDIIYFSLELVCHSSIFLSSSINSPPLQKALILSISVYFFYFEIFQNRKTPFQMNFQSRWFSIFYEICFFECKRFIYKLDFNIIILYVGSLVIYFRGAEASLNFIMVQFIYENKFMV